MEVEEPCIHEYVYWNEFQSKRFYQILPHGFDRQLSIPTKFAQNVKGLSGTVCLKGPARKTWKVELNGSEDGVCFQNGWSQFVRDNRLKAGNLLVFIYNEPLHFDVSIFDHESFCEKACSYFVESSGCRVTRRSRDDYEEPPPSHPHSPTLEPPSSSPLQPNRNCLGPSEAPAPAAMDGRPSRSTEPLSAKRKFWSEEHESSGSGSSSSDEEVQDCSSGDEAGGSPPGFTCSVREHISGRRPATEEEKKIVRRLADAALAVSSDKSFLAVMRKYHVYKRFQLTIPFDFALKYFSAENRYYILCCDGRKRTVRFKTKQNRIGGCFSKGWGDFVLENNIEEDDICLFELLEPVQKQEEVPGIIFNVRIFRAVEEMVPLTCCRSGGPSSTGRKTQRGGASGRGRGRGRGLGLVGGGGRGGGRGRGRGRGRGWRDLL